MKTHLIVWLVLIRGGSGKYESYQLGDQLPQPNSQFHPWNHSNPQTHPQPLNLSDHQSPPQQSNLQHLPSDLSLQQTQPGYKTTANCSCACRKPFKIFKKEYSRIINKPITGNILTCALPCKLNTMYPESNSKAVNSFLSFLAPTVFIISLFSITLTLTKMNRFTSLDQQIVLISVCFFFISFGYYISSKFSQHISCMGGFFQSHTWHLNCAAVFLAIYLSEIIISTAWTAQSCLWFLATAQRWDERRVERQKKKILGISFFVPLILAWAALQMNFIAGDPLTGICYLNIVNSHNLTMFIVIPLCLNLTIQIITSSCGYLTFYRVYNLAYSSKNIEAYEYVKKTKVPPGIFFPQMIMNVLFIFSMLYQSLYQNNWIRAQLCNCETAMDLIIEPIYYRHCADLISAIFVMAWNCMRNSRGNIIITKEQKFIKRASALSADRDFLVDSDSSALSGYAPMVISSTDEHCPVEEELGEVSGCRPVVNSYPWKRGPSIRTVPLWNEIRKLQREELEKSIRMRASSNSRVVLGREDRRKKKKERKNRGVVASLTPWIGVARAHYRKEQPDKAVLVLPKNHWPQRPNYSTTDDDSPPAVRRKSLVSAVIHSTDED